MFEKSSIHVEDIINSTVRIHTADIIGTPPEQFAVLAEELGITKSALKNFFR
ncbi:hypothetical protein [Bathymodiolus platifrons methanotrophic gill symbiont]|uniref:hypothetical protein n=1 Tax=Bathymodiolus platifrons methanotrophic gill symbiont TaxID=113268 RepID=UPI001C8EE509|nr:hypothetical protein [Bathymodiolus platifrons methanotrophic gill symbiont]